MLDNIKQSSSIINRQLSAMLILSADMPLVQST